MDLNINKTQKNNTSISLPIFTAGLLTLKAKISNSPVGVELEKYLVESEPFLQDIRLLRRSAEDIEINFAKNKRDIPPTDWKVVKIKASIHQDTSDVIYFRGAADNKQMRDVIQFYLLESERFKSDYNGMMENMEMMMESLKINGSID